ncbi:glycoside hydrolase family 18 protein [Durotheca rogersii]|uniref:glycoside hydrolase family 18 protein n=1 Tax=Durotheca rogersii TaxID=419775 RepID=UPI00221E53AD|nr:glycoside hydrolase family 18 protein [Durotheca rogersii]KAI5864100.1 glycoside hydrolase family 18 protein [Durotheca rogersii]
MLRLLSTVVTFTLWASGVLATFDPDASDHIAIYWGQNSAGVSDASKAQRSLSEYCASTNVDIIPIGFLSSTDPVTIDLSNMKDNNNIGEEITACQLSGKTVLMSVGGATLATGFATAEAAAAAADQVWGMFGPVGAGDASAARPFGAAVVDGFDLDIEAPLAHVGAFAARLRAHLDAANGAAGGRRFYLSAAPQCPFPDRNNAELLHGPGAVRFDFVMVQFYNNEGCDVRAFAPGGAGAGAGAGGGGGFNMAQWDAWARSAAAADHPAVKVFLGVPGAESAVAPAQRGSYAAPAALAPIVAYSRQFPSFGGVMVWDMSQVWANPGFLDALAASDGGQSGQQAAQDKNSARARLPDPEQTPANHASAARLGRGRDHPRQWTPRDAARSLGGWLS